MTQSRGARRPLDPPALADDVAESVRRLNHAIENAAYQGTWPTAPQDAYRIVGALVQAMRRLPRVLHEVDAFTSEPDGLRIDDGTDPATHLRRLNAAVVDAKRHTDALEAALNDAWSLLGTVGYAAPWEDA